MADEPVQMAYLDANAVIYLIEGTQPFRDLLEPVWRDIVAGKLLALTSELTVMESLVFPLRQSNATLTAKYQALFASAKLQLHPVSREILESAAAIRASTKTPDAIHLATHRLARCDKFVSADAGLRAAVGPSWAGIGPLG